MQFIRNVRVYHLVIQFRLCFLCIRVSWYFLTTAIPENSDVGTFVAMVTALDYDKPGTEHSEIKYSIEDMTTLFTMERLTGSINIHS